jgi:hypothetical protein
MLTTFPLAFVFFLFAVSFRRAAPLAFPAFGASAVRCAGVSFAILAFSEAQTAAPSAR